MKKNDIVILAVIAVFSTVFSLVLSRVVFGPQSRNLTAEKVAPISPDFKNPETTVFNEQAIDPTQLIHIGDNANQNPF